MQRYLYIPVMCLLALPAQAETPTITVTKADCRKLVLHMPDASVAYTPGVTADGRRVAPAELPGSGSGLKLPESFSMPVRIDLQERFGLPANKGQYMGELDAGTVEFSNGKVSYNGQELAAGSQNAIAAACRKLQRR
jgi:hypothetical protein